MSAWFFSRLIAWVKSGQLIDGQGYRLHRTPNGTTLVLNPSKGGATSPAAKSPGRFEISLKKDDGPSQSYSATFSNCYYDVGGKTYKMNDASLPGLEDCCIVFLRIQAAGLAHEAHIDSVSGLTGLQNLQEDLDYYTVPLYEIRGGSVVCDFRTLPIAAMGEA